MNRPVVCISQWMPEAGVRILEEVCELRYRGNADPLPRSELQELVADADALIFFVSDVVDEALLEGTPRLKLVASFGKGYDNVDLEACTRRGIAVTNLPDALTESTADHAIALLLSLCRKVLPGDDLVRAGTFPGWHSSRLLGRDFHRATLGIVGMGAVGQAVARRAVGFGTRIVYADPRPLPPAVEATLGAHRLPLDQLLAEADFVLVAVPLVPETVGLIGARELERMRPGALLVNVGRGSTVDEQAVAAALAAGKLGGYAADVFACEDRLLPDHPREVPARLKEMRDRTVLTPHLGTATWETRRSMAVAVAETTLQALRGERPPGLLNGILLEPLLPPLESRTLD